MDCYPPLDYVVVPFCIASALLGGFILGLTRGSKYIEESRYNADRAAEFEERYGEARHRLRIIKNAVNGVYQCEGSEDSDSS